MMRKTVGAVLLAMLTATPAFAKDVVLPAECEAVSPIADAVPGATAYVYKTTDAGRPLRIHVFAPAGSGNHPAILFFFGGGFRAGSIDAFADQARAFAARGYVAALADYRVSCRDGTNPAASVEDGQAAYAWLRRLKGVDRATIALSGGSSGGFIAAATAMAAPEGKRPYALILFNPAVDLRPYAAIFKLTPVEAAAISPAAMPIANLPSTIIFHGDADRTVPIAMVRDFCAKAFACSLTVYAGRDHGFFHDEAPDPLIGKSPYDDTLARALAYADAVRTIQDALGALPKR